MNWPTNTYARGLVEFITRPDFEQWLNIKGIVLDSRYPGTGSLTFEAATDIWCPWQLPADGENLAWFVHSVLEAAGKDQPWNVYPRHSIWPGAADGLVASLEVVSRGVGVPQGFDGAVRFATDEAPAVLALAVSSLVFGGTAWEDLYFIPASGDILLMASHHWEVIVQTPNQSSLDRYAQSLRDLGIPHPDDEAEETG